jgi:hypothetical protein
MRRQQSNAFCGIYDSRDAETPMNKHASTLIASVALVAGSACSQPPAAPSSRAIVTFAVAEETFRVLLTGTDQVAAARAALNGGRARIPNGRIVTGADVNTGWSWHLEDVAFAELTIEVCDGRPSDVERQGTAFGGGRFCPWTATITRIEER